MTAENVGQSYSASNRCRFVGVCIDFFCWGNGTGSFFGVNKDERFGLDADKGILSVLFVRQWCVLKYNLASLRDE